MPEGGLGVSIASVDTALPLLSKTAATVMGAPSRSNATNVEKFRAKATLDQRSSLMQAAAAPYGEPVGATTRHKLARHCRRKTVAKEAGDFFGIWRSLLQQWDAQANETLTKLTGQESFSREMNRAMGANLRMQAAFNEAVTKALVTLNLPSRADLARVAEQLNTIERKIDALRAGELSDTPAAPRVPRPARTRRPPNEAPS
jgi:hypothetical protein